MAEIKGTPLKDIVTVKAGDVYYGEEGDDEITLEKDAVGFGMAGNDTIIVAAGLKYTDATVRYWTSPGTILVDMEAGYALDGYGTRDTLVNVHKVEGFARNGDKGLGTSVEDYFWIGASIWNKNGQIYIDGRGGQDRVSIGFNSNDNLGKLIFDVTADGRAIKIHNENLPNFLYELRNIELLSTWDYGPNQHAEYDLKSMIDLSKAGQEVLLRGNTGWQSQTVGTPTALTYSFFTQLPATGGDGGTGFSALTSEMRQTVRDTFKRLEMQTGLSFSEVDGDAGQIRFGVNQQANTRAYAFVPDSFKGDARAGDVWLDLETTKVMSPGQEGYYVLLHELAHALGLQHPLGESDTSGATVLLSAFANFGNTLMLDLSSDVAGDNWPSWFGAIDVQTLRWLYGSRAYATESNVYFLTDSAPITTILDDGGADTLDVSTTSVAASIDLRPGKSSSVGLSSEGVSRFNNVTVSLGSVIENVVGTPYDDLILCNSQNNVITYMGGNDIVDGDAGIDVLRIWSDAKVANAQKDSSTGYWNIEATNNQTGSVELRNVERVVCNDVAVSLDSGDAESGGRTAKILGAIFGKEGLANLNFRGIGLHFFDQGMSYEALTLLALDARLGPGASKSEVANLLLSNVPGLVGNLNEFPTTTAMAMAAQESQLNKTMVDLVGLSIHGMPYIIFG